MHNTESASSASVDVNPSGRGRSTQTNSLCPFVCSFWAKYHRDGYSMTL